MEKEYVRQSSDEEYWMYGDLDNNEEYCWSELYGEQLINDVYNLDEMEYWWQAQIEDFNGENE